MPRFIMSQHTYLAHMFDLLMIIIFCIPLSISPQAFSQAGIGFEAEVLFQGRRVGVGHGHVTWLHGHELLVGLEVVVLGQHAGTDQLFLQDGHEVKEIFGGVVTNIIYFIRRNWQTIFAILLFWCVLHDTDYTFYDVVNECEVTFTVAIVENLDGFAFHQFVCKTEVRHIWATGRTIDCEEAKACGWNVIEFTIGMCHQLVALFGCSIKRYGIVNLVVC